MIDETEGTQAVRTIGGVDQEEMRKTVAAHASEGHMLRISHLEVKLPQMEPKENGRLSANVDSSILNQHTHLSQLRQFQTFNNHVYVSRQRNLLNETKLLTFRWTSVSTF